jgi:hypothetical protein
MIVPCFQDPQVPEIDQEVHFQDGTLPQLSEVCEMRGCLVCFWLVVQGKLLSHQIPVRFCGWLGFVGGVIIVPELGLPVYWASSSSLAYLEVDASASPLSKGSWGWNPGWYKLFLDLVCHLFDLLYFSYLLSFFCVPLCCSSLWHFCMSLFFIQILIHGRPDEESFYSFVILSLCCSILND